MKKIVGMFCLSVFALSLGWAVSTVYLTTIVDKKDIQLGRISAPEGTVLIVKNGSLELNNPPGHFSVEKPIMNQLEKGLWFITSIAALCSGLLLLRRKDKQET